MKNILTLTDEAQTLIDDITSELRTIRNDIKELKALFNNNPPAKGAQVEAKADTEVEAKADAEVEAKADANNKLDILREEAQEVITTALDNNMARKSIKALIDDVAGKPAKLADLNITQLRKFIKGLKNDINA